MPTEQTLPTPLLVHAVLDSFLNGHPEWRDADGSWDVAKGDDVTVRSAPRDCAIAVLSATDPGGDPLEFILALEPTDELHWRLHHAFVFRNATADGPWETFAIAPAHPVDIGS